MCDDTRSRRALRHSVTVAGGTALANAAEVGAQLIPVQVVWFFAGAVSSQGQPARVIRRLHATARTSVHGVSLCVAERVTDGGPVHRFRHQGTAQMQFLKTVNCLSVHRTLYAGRNGIFFFFAYIPALGLALGKYFRIRSDKEKFNHPFNSF
jgi:hypothetical protein